MTLLLNNSNLKTNAFYNDNENYQNEYLKNCVHQNKNHYTNKLINPKIDKAPKYNCLVNLFLVTLENTSFQEAPSRYLQKLINNWDYDTYGNEIIKTKFIKCVYGTNEDLILGGR